MATTPVNIEDIIVYLANGLETIPTVRLSYTMVIDQDTDVTRTFSYDLTLSALESTTTPNYTDYRLAASCAIPAKTNYQIILRFEDKDVVLSGLFNLKSDNPGDFVDQHDHLVITDRLIIFPASGAPALVAGDNRSQVITFEIDKEYDGISVLDETKHPQVDFIPAGYSEQELADAGVAFFYSKILNRTEQGDKVLLKWLVPGAVCDRMGVAKIALSILGDNYVWQTTPIDLPVSKNIGLRNFVREEGQTLEQRLEELEASIADMADFVNTVDYIDIQDGVLTYVERTDGRQQLIDITAGGAFDEGGQQMSGGSAK